VAGAIWVRARAVATAPTRLIEAKPLANNSGMSGLRSTCSAPAYWGPFPCGTRRSCCFGALSRRWYRFGESIRLTRPRNDGVGAGRVVCHDLPRRNGSAGSFQLCLAHFLALASSSAYDPFTWGFLFRRSELFVCVLRDGQHCYVLVYAHKLMIATVPVACPAH